MGVSAAGKKPRARKRQKVWEREETIGEQCLRCREGRGLVVQIGDHLQISVEMPLIFF